MSRFSLGQSLWEVIIAIALVALVAVGLVRASSFGVRNTRFSEDQSRLTSLAQERIGQVINYINDNYHSFWAAPARPASILEDDYRAEGDYCLATSVVDPGEVPQMAVITVRVFWESKNDFNPSSPDCEDVYFNHSLTFETKVAK